MSLGENLNHIGPALILYIGAGIVLTADLISGRNAPRWVLTIITLVAGLGWTWGLAMGDTRGDALNGAVEQAIVCPLGCSTTAEKCLDVDPSNGLASYLDAAADGPTLHFTGASTINARPRTATP